MRKQHTQPLGRTAVVRKQPPHNIYRLKPTWKTYKQYLAEDKQHSQRLLDKYGVPPYDDCLKLMPPEGMGI